MKILTLSHWKKNWREKLPATKKFVSNATSLFSALQPAIHEAIRHPDSWHHVNAMSPSYPHLAEWRHVNAMPPDIETGKEINYFGTTVSGPLFELVLIFFHLWTRLKITNLDVSVSSRGVTVIWWRKIKQTNFCIVARSSTRSSIQQHIQLSTYRYHLPKHDDIDTLPIFPVFTDMCKSRGATKKGEFSHYRSRIFAVSDVSVCPN